MYLFFYYFMVNLCMTNVQWRNLTTMFSGDYLHPKGVESQQSLGVMSYMAGLCSGNY
jgi:hypothetical protein